MVALTMAIAWVVGRWYGSRLHPLTQGRPAVSKFLDASLALLGLLIAFTFSTALSKHEERRLMVVADSNAIGDLYTCASLLKEPERTELRKVLYDYTTLRVDIAKRGYDPATFEHLMQRFQQMHKQMTASVSQALADGTSIAVPLTNALNATISSHTERVAAALDRLPPSIVVLLFLSAVLSTMLVGREQGVANEVDIAGTVTFIVLVSLAIFVILDLNQPNQGFINVSQVPIQRLLSSMVE